MQTDRLETITLKDLATILNDTEYKKVRTYFEKQNELTLTCSRDEVALVVDGGFDPGGMYGSMYLKTTQGDIVKRFEFNHRGKPSSNVAEYLSLIDALDYLHTIMLDEIGTVRLKIYTDSMLVVNQVNGVWGCHALHLRPLLDEVKDLLTGFDGWRLRWHGRANSVVKLGH